MLYLSPSKERAPAPSSSSTSRPKKRGENDDIQRLRQVQRLQAKVNQQTMTISQLQALIDRQAVATDAPERIAALQAELKSSQAAQAEAQTRLSALEAQLKSSQQDVTTLKAEAAQKGQTTDQTLAQLQAAQKQNDALQTELASVKQAQTALEGKNSEQASEVQRLTASLKAMSPADTELKTPAQIRDYAVGTSLGKDVLTLLSEKASQGVTVNQTLALTGITDAFGGKYKLPAETLAKALYDSEVALTEKAKQLKAQTEKKDAQFVAKFAKQKGVKKDPMGFYYRVDYAGKGALTSVVAVSVKESLTDGTVIKDMDTSGSFVRQPLSVYPPIFQKAIGQLQDHGSITLVVPPSLAYGDKGLPPHIPPGATMVYTMRIVDGNPQADGAGNAGR